MKQFTWEDITYTEGDKVISKGHIAEIMSISQLAGGTIIFYLASNEDYYSGYNEKKGKYKYSWQCKIKDGKDVLGDIKDFEPCITNFVPLIFN